MPRCVSALLLGNRLRLRERTQDILQHAGMGGIAALLASSVVWFGRRGTAAIAALLAAVVAVALVAWAAGL